MLPVVLSLLVIFTGSLGLPRETAGEFLPEVYLNQINDDSDEKLPSHAILTTYADGSPIPGLAESYLNASDQSSYIRGGEDAKIGEFPYMASIQVQEKGKMYHVCDGFLTEEDPTIVVTAAQCLEYTKTRPVMIALGAHQLSLGNKNPGYQWIHPYSYSANPKWKVYPWGKPNDLMVFRMKKPVKTTKYVKGIPISKKSPRHIYGWIGTIAGWGVPNRGYERRDILRKATMEIISYKECRRFWPDDELKNDREHICAFGKDETQSPCRFDAGSPLVTGHAVVGVASIWDLHCDPQEPSIYNVPYYHIQWLRKVMKGI